MYSRPEKLIWLHHGVPGGQCPDCLLCILTLHASESTALLQLVLLHLLSLLSLCAISVDSDPLLCGFFRVNRTAFCALPTQTKPCQSVLPGHYSTHAVHDQCMSELPRGISIGLKRGFWWFIEGRKLPRQLSLWYLFPRLKERRVLGRSLKDGRWRL